MHRLHKNVVLTACALTLAYIIASNALHYNNRTGPTGLVHAQASLFQPGARVGAIPMSNSPSPASTVTQYGTIFKVVSIDGDWARLRVDIEATVERAREATTEVLKTYAAMNDEDNREPTAEEMEQILEEQGPFIEAMLSMLQTATPTDRDLWINLSAYPAMWFAVE